MAICVAAGIKPLLWPKASFARLFLAVVFIQAILFSPGRAENISSVVDASPPQVNGFINSCRNRRISDVSKLIGHVLSRIVAQPILQCARGDTGKDCGGLEPMEPGRFDSPIPILIM